MEPQKPSKDIVKNTLLNASTAVVLGQVGVLTLVIILAAVGGGLWLDKTFSTRPLFTLILVLGSIPISLVLTVRTVKRALSRSAEQPTSNERDEDHG